MKILHATTSAATLHEVADADNRRSSATLHIWGEILTPTQFGTCVIENDEGVIIYLPDEEVGNE